MEGSQRRTAATGAVERSFECSRLTEQLLILAYEQVVPVIRHAVRCDPRRVRSRVEAGEIHPPSRSGVACS